MYRGSCFPAPPLSVVLGQQKPSTFLPIRFCLVCDLPTHHLLPLTLVFRSGPGLVCDDTVDFIDKNVMKKAHYQQHQGEDKTTSSLSVTQLLVTTLGSKWCPPFIFVCIPLLPPATTYFLKFVILHQSLRLQRGTTSISIFWDLVIGGFDFEAKLPTVSVLSPFQIHFLSLFEVLLILYLGIIK